MDNDQICIKATRQHVNGMTPLPSSLSPQSWPLTYLPRTNPRTQSHCRCRLWNHACAGANLRLVPPVAIYYYYLLSSPSTPVFLYLSSPSGPILPPHCYFHYDWMCTGEVKRTLRLPVDCDGKGPHPIPSHPLVTSSSCTNLRRTIIISTMQPPMRKSTSPTLSSR